MSNKSPIGEIEKALATNNMGLTIQKIMDHTGLARGTVKTYLDELIRMGRVHAAEYGQNTKVFFLNGSGQYQQNVNMYKDGVLFIDVMIDPWKNPFIRVKFRNHKKDIGAIFLNNETAVDQLIEALKKAKPQLNEYRQLVEKLEKNQ